MVLDVFRCDVTGRNRPAAEVGRAQSGRGKPTRDGHCNTTAAYFRDMSTYIHIHMHCGVTIAHRRFLALIIRVPGFATR